MLCEFISIRLLVAGFWQASSWGYENEPEHAAEAVLPSQVRGKARVVLKRGAREISVDQDRK